MTTDTVSPQSPPRGSPELAVVLRVAGVEKSFHRGVWPRRRTISVLKCACLEIAAGELVGLVGENGSGKSTLMQIIVGLLRRDAVEVRRPSRLGYCPQVAMLWEKLTVDEHFDLFARAYGLDEDAASRSIEALVAELDFAGHRGYRIEELSGGTRQKLNLALALMHEPELLLLDEPYSGFDWETYLRFWEMSERRRDAGMAILIVSHLLAERERLDRMFEIRDGRVWDAERGAAYDGCLRARAPACGADARAARLDPRVLRLDLRHGPGRLCPGAGRHADVAVGDGDQRRVGRRVSLGQPGLLPGQLLARRGSPPGRRRTWSMARRCRTDRGRARGRRDGQRGGVRHAVAEKRDRPPLARGRRDLQLRRHPYQPGRSDRRLRQGRARGLAASAAALLGRRVH